MNSLVERYLPELPPETESSIIHIRVPGELMKEVNEHRIHLAKGGRQLPKAAPIFLYFLALGIEAHQQGQILANRTLTP